jgi:hypothetical protein
VQWMGGQVWPFATRTAYVLFKVIARGSVLVKARCYKSEGPGFETPMR